ncbi:MAG: hypothetical protein AAGD96_08670, partial [Chloroflexota bacterium]
LIDTMARIALKPNNPEFHVPVSGGFVGYAPFREYEQELTAFVRASIFEARDRLNAWAFANE